MNTLSEKIAMKVLKLVLFDVLGKKVYAQQLNALSSKLI
jgi:hypothetical protein